MALERLEERLALSATASLDPSTYAAGSLLVKLKDPVADSLQYKSSGDELFGISSLSASTATVDPLAGLPTSVSDVLAGYGASGFGRVFPSVSSAGQDDTLFGISSLTASASTTTSDTTDDTAAWEIGLDRWVRIDLPEDADLEAIMASLEGDSSIAAVEPDFLFRMNGTESADSQAESTTASDGSVGALTEGGPGSGKNPGTSAWHLAAVNAQSAWSHLESIGLPAGGASDIVVAVIDTGVDYDHPDLAANMWVNTQEIAGNGIDDDGNGLVDDIHGATFISNTHYHNGDPTDDHSHGTHVAGIIAAARDNGVGGAGVAYNARIMALKALQYSGVETATDIAEAIYYAVEHGADIINMSFGSYSESGIIKDALEVAFGQCVLIAAAGNDGVANEPIPPGRPMYPADYNWVIGVQSTTQTSNEKTGYRASFSNYDTTPGTRHEYEVAAPGVDVLSSLPNNRYAAWDGTSMATPIVSGIAALLRTKFADKDMYSSRFIMGQLAVGGVQGGYHIGADEIINAARVLTDTPKPELKYLDHWVFDTEAQAAGNDDDGRVDAGETIDLAIALKNRWGKADNVQVTLDAYAVGANGPDPYVTINTGTVNYGAIGSFNEDDNGLVFSEGVVTGVNNPLTFTVSPDAPHGHIIPFRLTIAAGNGLRSGDSETYYFEERFSLVVQNAYTLPSVIAVDTDLDASRLWLIDKQTKIEEDATLRVLPNANVLFESSLWVKGRLIVEGNEQEPARLLGEHVSISADWGFVARNARVNGVVDMKYAIIGEGPDDLVTLGNDYNNCIRTLDHVRILATPTRVVVDGGITSSTFVSDPKDFKGYFNYHGDIWAGWVFEESGGVGWSGASESLLPSTYSWDGSGNAQPKASVIYLQGGVTDGFGDGVDYSGESGFANRTDSAFLLRSGGTLFKPGYARKVYWGPVTDAFMDSVVVDGLDGWNYGNERTWYPAALQALESTYPYVVDVELEQDGQTGSAHFARGRNAYGIGDLGIRITYNRDMDISVSPDVWVAPEDPLTDWLVDGSWIDQRTWAGLINVHPSTGDGIQYIRVSGGVAASDAWLVAGDDKKRFWFEVITSGAEAMNLQASGGEGQVDLSWVQDDFELLAGYNIYRSTSAEGTYTRVNQTLIPPDIKTFVDTGVQPAVNYFYKFRVAKTDGSESGDSNIASAAPLDTIPPQISHTPVAAAAPNFDFSLRADVTDNLAVESVTLNYRALGGAEFTQVAMTKTSGNRYSVTLDSTVMTAPGIEYFISATDGVTTVYSGLAASPYEITIIDAPAVTSITPSTGPVVGGTSVTIVGSNFKAGASVTIGGAPAANVVVVNSNQITATTPARFAAAADVAVINPDEAEGLLLNGFTYVSDGVVVSMPSVTADTGATIEVPISLSDVEGLLAAELTITFDAAVLTAQSVRTGALANGWALEANTATPGQVVITAAAATSVSATGALAYVTFNVVGEALVSTALTITSISLNDGAISTETANGAFTVNDVFSVGGTVRYYTGGQSIGAATLSLENSGLAVTTTATAGDGTFAFDGLRRDGYVLSAAKDDEVAEITAFDASLVLRSAAGLITLNNNQRLAADVNRNGSVSALDASYILQKSVGLIPGRFPGAGKYWDFVPAERTYADLTSDRTGQDFTAILIGDVSGNWGTTEPQGASSISSITSTQTITPNSTATLSLETLDILPGTSLPLPLVLNRGAEEIYSLNALIEYDPASVSITQSDVTAGTNDGSMFVVANVIEPGRLRLGIASSRPLPDQEAIATLTFTVNVLADETPITIKTASLDEGRVAATPVGGGFAALEPIEQEGEVRLSRNRDGLFYADNHRLRFRGQPVRQQLAAWSLLGAETIAGKNVAFVRHASGAQHRWRLDHEWSFKDPFEAIGNADVLPLPLRARQPVEFTLTAIPGGYVIDSLTNPTLTVHRGQKVTFDLSVTGHPFYLQTTGGGYVEANVFSEGFTGNGETTGRFEWVVPEDAPDELFYQSGLDAEVFGKIIVVD